ncbi:MAG: hypothetical protein AAF549_03720 [Pseudomonadota bacterium]
MRQSGNVFIIILVGIFLFASLLYVFSRSAQKGTGNIGKQQAQIAAQEILNYARSIEDSLNRLRQRNCSENDISFDNEINTEYFNANSPTDPNKCHIFDDEGGQLIYQSPNKNWTLSEQEWQFNASFQVTDIGTTCNNPSCADLNLHLADITNDICRNINQFVGIEPEIPTDSTYDLTPFTGRFGNPEDIADEVTSESLERQTTACVFVNGENYFYHVLLAR